MPKITSSNWEINGLAISFALHVVIVGFLLYEFTKPEVVISKPQIITMQIADAMSEPAQAKPTEPVKEKALEQKSEAIKAIKEVTKFIEKVQKVEKPKTISEISNVVQKEVQKIEPKVEPKEQVANKSEYKKTNFGIIRDKVLSHLRYPSIAKKMGWTGVTKVKLTIDKNGNLVDVVLSESSGKSQLDSAALSATRAIGGSNLPRPSETTDIILPISFDLKDED